MITCTCTSTWLHVYVITCTWLQSLHVHDYVYMYKYMITCTWLQSLHVHDYVYMYKYMITCTWLQKLHVHDYLYIITCTWLHVHVYIYNYMYTIMYTWLHVHVYNSCTCTCVKSQCLWSDFGMTSPKGVWLTTLRPMRFKVLKYIHNTCRLFTVTSNTTTKVLTHTLFITFTSFMKLLFKEYHFQISQVKLYFASKFQNRLHIFS